MAGLVAIRNVVDGYGDRYVIPTRSLLDDLAADFGHAAAGESLKSARDHSRRMVETGQAAECKYVEASRRETAIRFVIDAFNGRVDGILFLGLGTTTSGPWSRKSATPAAW